MLAYILAILVGGGSVGLYIAAFFFPEIHRKNDFIWSGVGFFYALFLWIYARQITGGLLVGQIASVALIGWFVWQTVKLRRQIVPANQQTPLPSTGQLQQQLGLQPPTPKTQPPQAQTPPQPPRPPKTTAATPQPPTRVSTATPVKPSAPSPKTTVAPPPSPTTAKLDNPSPTPTVAATTEDPEPWIELKLTPPQPPTETRLGQAIQPPVAPPMPKPEVTQSVPSQPDAPLPPPPITPVERPTTAEIDPTQSANPQTPTATEATEDKMGE